MTPWMTSALSMMSGASLAIVPAATLSIASRIFDGPTQGAVAVAVSVATFVAQLAGGAIVEARLSSGQAPRRLAFPLWLVALTGLATLIAVVAVDSAIVLCVALPVLLAALEVGRGIGVAEHRDLRELSAGAAVGAGALLGVLAAFGGQRWALIPLVVGIAVATAIRCIGVSRERSRIDPRVARWVVTDVGVTGVIYPVLNALILVSLGPASSVVFAAVSTVSGLLAVPLNFMRLRLLKAHAVADIVLSSAAVVLAAIALLAADLTGALGLLFGDSWATESTLVPLLIACLWRAGSLGATLPFAALRRAGRVGLLTVLRGAAALLTLGLAAGVLPLDSVALVFAALLVGEAVQFVFYETARRRVAFTPR